MRAQDLKAREGEEDTFPLELDKVAMPSWRCQFL